MPTADELLEYERQECARREPVGFWVFADELRVGDVVVAAAGRHVERARTVTRISTAGGRLRQSYDTGERTEWGHHPRVRLAPPFSSDDDRVQWGRT